jgi:hypothetical protein
MTDETCDILCLIEGDTAIFSVIASPTIPIAELKDLIKEERKNGVLKGILAKDLTVWKVRMTRASNSTTNSPAG